MEFEKSETYLTMSRKI